jgi:hypothetical protein
VDAVDGPVRPTCTPPSGAIFKLGRTKVVCRAKDSRGNTTTFSFALDLRDTTPPPRVSGLAMTRAAGGITLSWRKPRGTDFAGVVVERTPGGVVYTGSKTSFTDRRVSPGVDYRYEVFSVDHAGNRSAALVAGRGAPAIVSPAPGSELTSPPLLEWREVANADYYNVQLYRGREKILSIWPTRNELQLSRSWTYGGESRTLSPGAYRWYVWPGFGALAAARYGSLLGSSTFVIRP